jgi:2,3-bisphosphoglycerate-independent phosphoglycerate mutase
MGNSEVGHLTMGAGNAEPQALEVIDRSIADGTFFANGALRAACAAARAGQTLHLMGLLSTGGVHADMKHLDALIELARREDVDDVVVHAFLDGRDMPPRSALPLIARVGAPIATVHGRFYAMDRDKRWERTFRSYRAIVDADGPRVAAAADALRECYAHEDCRDELLEPYVVGEGRPIADRDAVIFFNFRPDRARQLTWALMQADFSGFPRPRVPRDLTYVTMTEYNVELPNVVVAFAPQPVISVAELVAEHGLRQFHVAETEKYAHVTYFFNGGREKPFANPDMVGHTGVFDAALRAMAATDAAVGVVADAVLEAGGCVLLTADHGNVEEMAFPDGGLNTQHSTNPVPVAFVSADAARWTVRDGDLADVGPTLLELLGVAVPKRMTGRSLLAPR